VTQQVDAITRTLLYEGYLLYPYRRSAVKNRHRFNFGVLYPEDFGAGGLQTNVPGAGPGTDRSFLLTECPLKGSPATRLVVSVRFLQLIPARTSDNAVEPDERALERSVIVAQRTLGELCTLAVSYTFGDENVHAAAETSAREVRSGLYTVCVRVWNATRAGRPASRDEALLRSLVSTHVILDAADGAFISLLDPPAACADVVADCRNIGVWPVLVGDPGTHDCVLASPIVLYDYPRVAPESAGDLFDGTEIDEILALRILTLTDEEKREARNGDARAREILDRTERLRPEDWARLHGTNRGGDE
jgi:hydrogenase maturation protease